MQASFFPQAGDLRRSGSGAGDSFLSSVGSSGNGRVIFEEVPASDSTDEATRQTVEKMCEYIRSSSQDPGIAAAAEYAARHFSLAGDSDASLAWAVFWYVKHCVKFRLDEATMFRIGREHEHDLLIAPDLLVRMKDPAEDCDGFTMLTAALLMRLGVPVYIVTVAANPSEPQRWSHVFAITLVDGRVLPLDTSHGPGPGWMVPRDRIYRWQAWDLDARPVDISPSNFRGLHGYVRSGLGQMCEDGTDDCLGDFPTGAVASTPPAMQSPTALPLTPLPVVLPSVSVAAPTSTAPASVDPFAAIMASLIGNAAKVATVAETPTTTITLPNGTVVSGVASSSAASLLGSANLTSLLPIAGIALLGLLVISFMGRNK